MGSKLQKINVYQSEVEAGLSDIIQKSCARLSAPVSIRSTEGSDQTDLVNKIIDFIRNGKDQASIKNLEDLIGHDQPDLALVVSILVSAGWNLNDDIFMPSELWAARNTPIHKPINDNHDEEVILGHIITSRAINKNGDSIVEVSENNLPSDFDLEVAGVLYKALPKLQDRISEIIEKANSGEMFVSMEAWFPDFAFGILDEDTGVTKVVARTEKTAFLTKHLRAFRGTGEFNGKRVGRVLLDITFGGQGFVETPANPDSVIKVAASQEFISASLEDVMEGGVQDVDLETLKKELKDAQDKLQEKDAALADLRKEIESIKSENSKAEIDELSQRVEELTNQTNEMKTKLEESEKEKAELSKNLEKAEENVAEANEKLLKIEKDAKAKERLTKLKEVSDVENEEEALADIMNLDDATFDAMLKYAGKKAAANNDDNTNVDNNNDQNDKDVDKVLDTASAEVNDPDFNANQDNVEESEQETARALAYALCGQNPSEKD